MKKIKVGIIGGGRFGLTLAESLSANDVDVTLVDRNWHVIQSLAESSIRAVQGDATNPAVLRDAGFADCDIAIYGHTDSTGSDAVNNPLSVNRAKAVQTYLLQQGVKTAQIRTCDGQGSTNPVADNSTAEGRQQNRRVEIYMYASQAMINAAEAGTLQ